MSPLGYLKIFIVKLDELSIGSTLNLTFRDTVFSAYIGLDERYLDLKVSNYLDWNSLLWCYKKSFCYYDLGLTTKEIKVCLATNLLSALKIQYILDMYLKIYQI